MANLCSRGINLKRAKYRNSFAMTANGADDSQVFRKYILSFFSSETRFDAHSLSNNARHCFALFFLGQSATSLLSSENAGTNVEILKFKVFSEWVLLKIISVGNSNFPPGQLHTVP